MEDNPIPPPSDGQPAEVVRRPRGRPRGSKNKPKPPVFNVRQRSMASYVLEVPPGVDVVEVTTRFCRSKGIGLCVHRGHGFVENVTLKNPPSIPDGSFTIPGRCDIMSMSVTVLPGGCVYPPALANVPFAVTVVGPQGQTVGGLVIGPLVSAGTVYLFASTFNSPVFEQLQADASSTESSDETPQALIGASSVQEV